MATSAERLQQYEDLLNKSQAFNPAQFQQDFEKSYGEATGYNQDLINQQSQALGQLQAVAPELRQRYSSTLIKDPTLQRSLIAQARQAPITDYSNAVNLLGQRGQRYSDILSSALSGYQTSAQQAQTAAENAWRLYQDQLAQEEAARARAAASSGSSLSDLLSRIYSGNQTQQTQPQGGGGGGYVDDATPSKNITQREVAPTASALNMYRNADSFGGKVGALALASIPKTIPELLSLPYQQVKNITAFAPDVWSDIKGLFNRK